MLRRPDFLLCYDAGRRHYTRRFVVFTRRRDACGTWRLGLAVTRKTGCAVVRNRVKRVLREFFRLNQAHLPEGMDIVVVPKRAANLRYVTLAVVAQEFLPFLETLGREFRASPQPFAAAPDAADGGME